MSGACKKRACNRTTNEKMALKKKMKKKKMRGKGGLLPSALGPPAAVCEGACHYGGGGTEAHDLCLPAGERDRHRPLLCPLPLKLQVVIQVRLKQTG